MEPWAEEVRRFWFGLPPESWWRSDPDFDAGVRERFLPLWEEQRSRLAEDFLGSAGQAVAAAILFDQFPRNMFRGHADSFATDHLARAIARGALDRGYDAELDQAERIFLYMPFQHSEDLADQQRALTLFAAMGDPELLHYARLHHDVIERFGRFPHRNAILGREPRPDELAAGDVVPW
jgi:uncharacterized protein (DUF924 family)